ncbi:xanthine dehydrogenase family protein molybdopterin-binding subunit [Chloroflexota bacterium]
MNVVGKRIKRIDALEKVTGKALFADDLKFDNMLYAKVLRSPLPHAKIKKVDISLAKELRGVRAVLTARDIPGEKNIGYLGDPFRDQPVLADDKVRCEGDPIAIVAADSKEIAEEAIKLVQVEYEELQPVFDLIKAMSKDVPRVHEGANVVGHRKIRRGGVEAGFAEADVIIEGTYKTPFQEHAYLEPEAGVARMDNTGNITVWACTQFPCMVREDIARVLRLSLNKVRVIHTTTGGAFGGKADISVHCHIALLAFKTGKPVKLVYNRSESVTSTTKRHPFIIKYKTGATREGKLLAVEAEIIGDTGAYMSCGVAVLSRAAIHATGPYNVPNVKIDAYTVYTNNPIGSGMRGFGIPQIAIAHEAQMDKLAEELGMDPIEIRLKNALEVGSRTATGQFLTHSICIKETLEQAQKVAREWQYDILKSEKSNKRRGVGVGSMWYGIGSTGYPNPAGAFVELLDDGSAMVLSGCAEIGQGSDTVLAQIAAEELGTDAEKVTVITADTGVTPWARGTGASGQTYIAGNAVRLAAIIAKETLFQQTATDFGVTKDKLYFDDGAICVMGSEQKILIIKAIKRCRSLGILTLGHGSFNPDTIPLDPQTGEGSPYTTYSFATDLAEVEVDTKTGETKVLKLAAFNDVGKAINLTGVEGQLEGGLSLGLGCALMEELIVDKSIIKTPTLAQYLIPTAMDMPEDISVGIIEEVEPSGPFGAKGVGEPASIPTAPAILGAIYAAVGARINEPPATSERILAAIQRK